jgi:hypothetical protein
VLLAEEVEDLRAQIELKDLREKIEKAEKLRDEIADFKAMAAEIEKDTSPPNWTGFV